MEASCSNCVRRGTRCGVKLPGPKTLAENAANEGDNDRTPQRMNEYVRLFERFQRLRPEDGPDEIDRLIELVENGTLKERDGNFIVAPPRDGEVDEEFGGFRFGGGELTWGRLGTEFA